MKRSRRTALQAAGGLGVYAALAAIGLLPCAAAEAFSRSAFQIKTLPEALEALGVRQPGSSADVTIIAPEIAENGAVVPVGIRSNLPSTDFMALLVEKNPQPLAGAYTLLDGVEPNINMRIKMSQSSDVIAIVRAGGKYYMARKQIKVTLGGCGG